jgi:hypothetical protein
MKKLMIIAVLFLSACTKAVPVDNKTKAKGSEYKLQLIATTPEGVNIYKITSNAYYDNFVAVNPKTGDVSVAIH